MTVTGSPVQPAEKQPITPQNIKTSLMKLGNSSFSADEEEIILSLDEGAFYSLKALNELRRLGIQALEEDICAKYGRKESDIDKPQVSKQPFSEKSVQPKNNPAHTAVHIAVHTIGQLDALLKTDFVPDILYMDSELAEMTPAFINEVRVRFAEKSGRKQYADTGSGYADALPAIYVALPYIIRKKDITCLEKIYPALCAADGVLVRNAESYYWLSKHTYKGKINTDAGIYSFNRRTLDFWQEKADICCLPYELNRKEINHLLWEKEIRQNASSDGEQKGDSRPWPDTNRIEQIVYGRIPLMLTANCVAKTMGNCQKGSGPEKGNLVLTDRYHKQFPVETRCRQCYNIIYNSLPLSLHEKAAEKLPYPVRIQFTVESAEETKAVIHFFEDIFQGKKTLPPYPAYTLGHEKRGVE